VVVFDFEKFQRNQTETITPSLHQYHLDWKPLSYLFTLPWSFRYFESKVNEYYSSGKYPLRDGYAPFCKHVFLPSFLEGMKSGTLTITEENVGQLRTVYEARTDKELPVMVSSSSSIGDWDSSKNRLTLASLASS